jgi:hypothetical protein
MSGELVSLGHEIVAWIEHYLRHGPGDVQDQPIVMDDERYATVLRMYRLRPRPRCAGCRTVAPPEELADAVAPWRCWKCKEFLEVRRAVDEYVLSRRKGWSKSGLASQVGPADALGPARFDGWSASGQPAGRPVRYPFVRCLGTEEGQSAQTFRGIAYVLHPENCSDDLGKDYRGIDAGRDWQTCTRILLPDGGEIRPSTASSAAKDGGKESLSIADETHLYVTPELHSMYQTVHRNTFKRRDAQGWMLQTTTMYRLGARSVAEETFEAVETGNAPGVVLDHRQSSRSLDSAVDLDDMVALLGEAAGDAALFLDLEREGEAILSGRYDQPDRYAANRPTQHDDDWCDLDAFKARSRRKEGQAMPRPPDGTRITLGFDGSHGTSDNRIPDSTVLRGAVLEQGPWFGCVFTLGLWEADGDPDWEPPWDEIDAAVDQAHKDFDVWRGYYDPPYFRDWIRAWKARHGDERVVEWETYRDRQMAAALESLHQAIHTADGDFSHDGDERAEAHYGNARKRVKKARVESDDPDGKKELVLVRKETPRSAKKIDAVVGDALAWWCRGDGIAAGAHIVRRRTKAYGF